MYNVCKLNIEIYVSVKQILCNITFIYFIHITNNVQINLLGKSFNNIFSIKYL